jgi:site-specific DNA-methyltransferase (adenine-specific)
MSEPTCKIICGDALEELRKMEAGSVDAIVTDPPYGSTKSKISGWRTHGMAGSVRDRSTDFGEWDIFDLSWLPEAFRVLRDDAPVVAFCPDWGVGAMRDAGEAAGFKWRQAWYWHKPNPPMSFRGLLQFSVEPMVYLVKGSHVVRVENAGRAHNVFEYPFPTDPAQRYHPNQKPIPLMRHILRTLLPSGSTVLDCFAGSGSTGVAAARESMSAILIEQNADYCEMARRRVAPELVQTRLPLESHP